MKKILLFILISNVVFAQQFHRVDEQLNIEVVNNITVQSGWWGNGVSFYDFNQDGWDDLTFAMENDSILFFKNNEGIFEKLSTFIPETGRVKMILWVDYDNDGFMDLFFTTYLGAYKLYKNNGDFTFTDVSISAGLPSTNVRTWGASFGDYNKDGLLDLYIANYDNGIGDLQNPMRTNQLFKNNGDGTFSNVTEQAGVGNGLQLSFTSVWLDYNNNSWPDLYVINDRHPYRNALYRNNGDGTFTDLAEDVGADAHLQDPMSISVCDFDNDGDLDIYMTNSGTSIREGMLLVNNGDGSFAESATDYGVNMQLNSWGALWIDANNNTYNDLYISTQSGDFPNQTQGLHFSNNSGQNFTYTPEILPQGNEAINFTVAKGDINNDGFYDFVNHNMIPHESFLYQNTGGENNYIKITLEGTISNKMAIGSWIRVYAGGNQYTQYTLCGENYLGQNSQHHIFGLTNFEIVDSVEIEFLSGIVDKYYNLNVNQHFYFVEGETHKPTLAIEGSSTPCEGDTVEIYTGSFSSYEWSNGTQDSVLKVSESGNYWLIASDSLGNNFYSDTLTIAFNVPPLIEVLVTNPSCFNAEDGEIYLNFSPDVLSYQLLWNDSLASDTLKNAGAGVHTFKYMDDNGCKIEDAVELMNPQEINIQTLITQQEEDSTLYNLMIQINGGQNPYEVFLNENLIAIDTIEVLSEGEYILKVIDANGCELETSIEVFNHFVNSIYYNQNINFEIWPNPTHSQKNINIQFNKTVKEINISIVNILGQVVYQKDFSELNKDYIQVNFDKALKRGYYFIVITEKELQNIKPLILE